MLTRTSILALAATAMVADIASAPTGASAGWWDRYQDRKDIRHDYADIRHDLLTGHFADASTTCVTRGATAATCSGIASVIDRRPIAR